MSPRHLGLPAPGLAECATSTPCVAVEEVLNEVGNEWSPSGVVNRHRVRWEGTT